MINLVLQIYDKDTHEDFSLSEEKNFLLSFKF